MAGYEHLCMNCMSETDGKEKCPKCGFAEEEPQVKEALSYRTVLQDRYMVGRLKHANGEGKFYIGFDMQQLCPVQIHEFFPLPICARVPSSNDIAVIAGNEGVFDQYLQDFLTYQRALAQFKDQPAMIPVIDVFEENYTAYAISPWEESITLRYFVERSGGFLTWNAGWKLFRPVIAALSSLHASGVGHLGISPDTLVISPEGEMKLSGFCISAARMADAGLQFELVPGCAAIEQYDASMNISESTDVYGLASALFFALTGVLPHEAKDRLKDPRLLLPASKLKSIPPHVVTAMANALQVSPQDRTPTFERMRAELAAAPTATVSLEETQSLRRIPSPYDTQEESDGEADARGTHGKKPTYLWVILVCVILAIAAILFIWAYNLFGIGTPSASSSQPNIVGSLASGTASAQSAAPPSEESSSEAESEEQAASSQAASSGGEQSASSAASQDASGKIEVPNLVGMQFSDIPKSDAYQVRQYNKEFSSTIPEGEVTAQDPSGGMMEPGQIIDVTVSLGPALRELPEIAGKTEEEARTVVENAGFLPSFETIESDEPAGTVLGYKKNEDGSQLAAGAQLGYGAEVAIQVSGGASA